VVFKIRTTKTGSGNIAVQVVYRQNQNTIVVKHIGTAHDKQELESFTELANEYILSCSPMRPLFPEILKKDGHVDDLVSVKNISFTKTYHTFTHEFLSVFYDWNGFAALHNNLLRDLSFMRIIEPSSKIRSAELFNKYFGYTYTPNMVYKSLPKIRLLKEAAEKEAVSYARKHLSFDFRIVFYDVTTLYFETFTEDGDETDTKGNITKSGLRKNGFGKERKQGQPIILIGLVVNSDGYPISVEMFSGKTFEGHTMLPVIKNLQEKYGIKTLTIVADAAMLSLVNTKAIAEAELSYIVGARMGSIPEKLLKDVAKKLNKTENKYIRVKTDWGKLICDYSEKRAAKDRSERKKQLAKAAYQIENPDKVKRRTRFVMEKTKATLTLNEALIKQDELREGIKGYYTNLKNVPSRLIIKRYHDLWQVEKSFRMAKSDLEARPVFHHKKESIETHIIIVFVSLCIAKSIELKTGYSIKKVKDMVWDVLDIEFEDTLTGKQFRKRMDTTSNPMAVLLEKMNHVLKG
jgi:transposase